jgi:hypothetical protein
VALETNDEWLTRATYGFVLDGPNLHTLTNVMVTETTELRTDQVLQVYHFVSVELRRLLINFDSPLRLVRGSRRS